MFRKSENHKSGKHTRPQPHGKGKPAMLAQIRKQHLQEKPQKAEKKFYSAVRSYQKSYKPLGSFIEIILRLRGVVHVICTQNAATLHEKKNQHSSSHKRSANYFFYHQSHQSKSLADTASAARMKRI